MLELALKEYYDAIFIESLKKNRLLRRLLYGCIVGLILPLIINWRYEYYFGAAYIAIMECVIVVTIIMLYPKKLDCTSETFTVLPIAFSAIEYIWNHNKIPLEVKNAIKDKYTKDGYVTYEFLIELDFKAQKKIKQENKTI